MRRQQNEGRIRELWMELAEKHREGILDVIIFSHDLARNCPDLLTTFEGDSLPYLKDVLSGLYRRT